MYRNLFFLRPFQRRHQRAVVAVAAQFVSGDQGAAIRREGHAIGDRTFLEVMLEHFIAAGEPIDAQPPLISGGRDQFAVARNGQAEKIIWSRTDFLRFLTIFDVQETQPLVEADGQNLIVIRRKEDAGHSLRQLGQVENFLGLFLFLFLLVLVVLLRLVFLVLFLRLFFVGLLGRGAEHLHFLLTLDVPDLDRRIVAPRSKKLAVGAEGD